jgi:hypothetical protein
MRLDPLSKKLSLYILSGCVVAALWMFLNQIFHSEYKVFEIAPGKFKEDKSIASPELPAAGFVYDKKPLQLQEQEGTWYEVNGMGWTDKYATDIFSGSPFFSIQHVPTSYRFKHPNGDGLPFAFQVSCFHTEGRKRSPLRRYTYFNRKSELNRIALFIREKDLFAYEKGIYVIGASEMQKRPFRLAEPWWERPANYHQRGKAWKRKVFFQYYSADSLLYEAECKMAIHGNATRAYPQKSLRLESARKEGFSFSFFEDRANVFDALILRNGGNDWDRTMIADPLAHEMALLVSPDSTGMPDVMHYRPVEVYINGAYWGLHQLRDRLDEDGFSKRYGLAKKKLDIMEGTTLAYGLESSAESFQDLLKKVDKLNLDQTEDMDWLKSQINYPNFVTYLAVEIFCANSDWPANNVKCYRFRDKDAPYGRDKWSWVIWDMDYSFHYTGAAAVDFDMFKHLEKYQGPVSKIASALFRSQNGRADFQVALERLSMSTEIFLMLVDHFENEIKRVMPDQIVRWRKPESESVWRENVNGLRSFLRKRGEVVMRQWLKRKS